MDKRKLIFTSLIVLALVVAALSISYALNVAVTEGTSSEYDLSYTFDISDNATWTINVPAGKTKVYDISVTNPYNDIIKYGVVYKLDNPTTMPSNSLVGVLNTTENSSQGNINANSTLEISVAIVNNSSSNMQVTLAIVNGYKNGGDLIIPSGYTLITKEYTIKPSATPSPSPSPSTPSTPNSPDLIDGLIPVVYNSSTAKWVKADSTNTNNSWYNYDNKMWANAVLVSSASRKNYKKAPVGTEIAESEMLAFYVWIPRYKYKVWNINMQRSLAYDAYNGGIDIVFESGTSSTGEVSCTSYNFTVGSTKPESCGVSGAAIDGYYYTHPAFYFDNIQLRGIWVGKFKLSSNNQTENNYGGGTSVSLVPFILPNKINWINNTIGNFNTVVQNMSKIYEFSSSDMDSHIITNMEWGAVAYLTNSKYGRCTDSGGCVEVSPNANTTSSYDLKTGCGPKSEGDYSLSETCNEYNTELGMLASTTGNVSGVYDMSSATSEFVMGNISSSTTSYVFNPNSSGFDSSWYNAVNSKYLSTYMYGNASYGFGGYARGRLGDATGEIALCDDIACGWYDDLSIFPSNDNNDMPWFVRGGKNIASTGELTSVGIFSFCSSAGSSEQDATPAISTRAVLVNIN